MIVKEQYVEKANELFRNTNIQITTRGERHLGAVIGSDDYKSEYCNKMVNQWVQELSMLSRIAITQPQEAYTCYISGYQHRFSYFVRTIPGIEKFLDPVEDVIRHQFIPAITDGHVVNDEERMLMSLPPRLGGLGLKNICEYAPVELENSKQLTYLLQKEIVGKIDDDSGKTIAVIKSERRQQNKEKLELLRANMNEEQKRINDVNMMVGASNWLTSLPIKELMYDLNKEQFRDALRIRYNWALPRLPSDCACGSKFNVTHALSCKKGGFITMRHNEVRDITSVFLNEVCKDVRREPMLIQLDGEQIQPRSANRSQEARLDISAIGFWTPGQRVFLDIRVFDLNARRYQGLELNKCFKRNEDEKKRQYNERVLDVDNGSFTPLVFSTNGGMGRECKLFYKRLSEMIAEKRDIPVSQAVNYIRTKISFSLLRSMLLCLRGSRSLKKEHYIHDIELSNVMSTI